MAKYDDLDVKRIFGVGIASVVVTAVTALAVQVVYYHMVESTAKLKSEQSSYETQNSILATQMESISGYGVDAETGNVVIPIEEAMELAVQESQSANSADESKKENESQPDAA
ncbi:hypothetical protein [Stieleria varia]|uniref:Uncharacterized protein n=1 Tax=Stieleria varia TaxID=2528005 RepID=A0A5C6B0H2_9BACT|nr:hypothetical protein [Stieleria varia]TWU04959.1 hypothetical protein Pla52n_30040 [Stieleria varia]